MDNALLMPGWERVSDTDIKRIVDAEAGIELIIHKYPHCASQYCCHIIRGDLRYCPEIAYSLAEAYAQCEKHLSMPVEDLKQLVILDELRDLARIHKKLKALGYEPAASEYEMGYKDGKTAANAEMAAALRYLVEIVEAA